MAAIFAYVQYIALRVLTAYKKLHEKEDSARLVFGRRRSSGCVVLYLI